MLEKLIELGEKHARKCLLERRERQLAPIYHLIAPPGGEDRIVQFQTRNDIEKQILVAQLRDMAREMGAVAGIFIGEAWVAVANYDGLNPAEVQREVKRLMATPPSQRPDRREIVALVATDGERSVSSALQIVRDKPGGRIISLVKDTQYEGASLAGRFVDGIIKPRKS